MAGYVSGLASLGWAYWNTVAETLYYFVAIGAAIGALWVYGSNSRLERAKWAAGLYEKFYERDHLKRIRDLLDPPTDPAVVRALVDAQPPTSRTI